MPFFQYLQLIISDTYLQLYSLSLLTSKQILKSFVLSFHKFLILHYPKNYFDKLNVSRWWKGETLVHLKSYSEWKKNENFHSWKRSFGSLLFFSFSQSHGKSFSKIVFFSSFLAFLAGKISTKIFLFCCVFHEIVL